MFGHLLFKCLTACWQPNAKVSCQTETETDRDGDRDGDGENKKEKEQLKRDHGMTMTMLSGTGSQLATGNWQPSEVLAEHRQNREWRRCLGMGRETQRERGRLVGVSGDICFDVVIWLSFGLVRGQPINFHALLRCLHRESPLKWKEMAEGDLFVYLVGLNSSGCRECLCCLHKLWRRRLSLHSFK